MKGATTRLAQNQKPSVPHPNYSCNIIISAEQPSAYQRLPPRSSHESCTQLSPPLSRSSYLLSGCLFPLSRSISLTNIRVVASPTASKSFFLLRITKLLFLSTATPHDRLNLVATHKLVPPHQCIPNARAPACKELFGATVDHTHTNLLTSSEARPTLASSSRKHREAKLMHAPEVSWMIDSTPRRLIKIKYVSVR